MRTYGRLPNDDGTKRWVEVQTSVDGFDDYVRLTELCQVCLLNKNESPYYADWGISAKNAVIMQIAPDLDMMLIQQRFAPYFASLTISKLPATTPTYRINVTTNQGVKLVEDVAT